jgi:hypothetical protein
LKNCKDIALGVSDRYSPASAADANDGALSSRIQDSRAISVEAVELADDEGKLEIDDRCEGDDNEEDGDGSKTPPVSSTAVPENNKKEQPDTGESSLFFTVLHTKGSCPIFVEIFE